MKKTANSTELTIPSPSRHLTASITFLVLIPLVYFIPTLVHTHVTDHALGSTVLTVGIIVPTISYAALPLALKLRAQWIAARKHLH